MSEITTIRWPAIYAYYDGFFFYFFIILFFIIITFFLSFNVVLQNVSHARPSITPAPATRTTTKSHESSSDHCDRTPPKNKTKKNIHHFLADISTSHCSVGMCPRHLMLLYTHARARARNTHKHTHTHTHLCSNTVRDQAETDRLHPGGSRGGGKNSTAAAPAASVSECPYYLFRCSPSSHTTTRSPTRAAHSPTFWRGPPGEICRPMTICRRAALVVDDQVGPSNVSLRLLSAARWRCLSSSKKKTSEINLSSLARGTRHNKLLLIIYYFSPCVWTAVYKTARGDTNLSVHPSSHTLSRYLSLVQINVVVRLANTSLSLLSSLAIRMHLLFITIIIFQ